MAESIQTFIEKRQRLFMADYNTLDVDTFMNWFSDDTSITNYGNEARNWTKQQESTFLKEVLTTKLKADFETVGVHGTKEFCAWEWTCHMTILEESPLFPLKVGDTVNLVGVTMLWWDMSEGDYGKIKKHVEYNKVV